MRKSQARRAGSATLSAWLFRVEREATRAERRSHRRRSAVRKQGGVVVTVVGWNSLSFTLEVIRGQVGLGAVAFDVIAVPVATLGMMILLGSGAAVGGTGRVISARCRYGRRLPRVGSPIS